MRPVALRAAFTSGLPSACSSSLYIAFLCLPLSRSFSLSLSALLSQQCPQIGVALLPRPHCVCISFHFICTDQRRRYFYVPCDNYQTIKTINCDDTIKAQSKVARPLVTRLQPAPPSREDPVQKKKLPRCGQVLSLRVAFASFCLYLLKREGEMGETTRRSTRRTSKGTRQGQDLYPECQSRGGGKVSPSALCKQQQRKQLEQEQQQEKLKQEQQ